MMLAPNPQIDTTRPAESDATHGVCACQVDATPRLALCGADCTDEAEGFTATPCVVCFDMFIHRTPCSRCGGLD